MSTNGNRSEESILEALRDRHIGRLLLRAHRAFSARAAEKLHQRGYAGITLAHIALLPHLDETGTRVTTLAERAGMTKQGMGQLVNDLERQGYLERSLDPSDARATLVRFTEPGRDLLREAVDVTRELEDEYRTLLGGQHLDALRAALSTIAAASSQEEAIARGNGMPPPNRQRCPERR